jgi:phage gp45-like
MVKQIIILEWTNQDDLLFIMKEEVLQHTGKIMNFGFKVTPNTGNKIILVIEGQTWHFIKKN